MDGSSIQHSLVVHLAHSPSLLLGQGHRPFYLVQAHNEEVPRDCVLLNE